MKKFATVYRNLPTMRLCNKVLTEEELNAIANDTDYQIFVVREIIGV